jgi:tRNA (guanine-N7-)-methyltransferase
MANHQEKSALSGTGGTSGSTSGPYETPVQALIVEEARSLPSFTEIFGNANPVEVEIGCGKAKFLMARAAEFPHINFLGIDYVWKWMRFAVERTERRSLENIKFLRADAREAVEHGLAKATVSIFHIYFPDPWPKRRHRKRRIVTADFLRALYERLTDVGLIEMATDDRDYYLQMQGAAVQSGMPWRSTRAGSGERLFPARMKTNYEIKYAAVGKSLYYLELEK